MKKRVSTCLLSLPFFLGFFLYLISGTMQRVWAQGLDLSISPPLTVKQTNEGNIIRIPLKIINNGSSDQTVTPSIRRFTSDQQSGTPIIDFNSSITYIRIETAGFGFDTPFTVSKGQTQDLVLAVTPPSPLREDVTAIFLLEGTTGSKLAQSGTTIRGILGSNIIIKADEFYSQKAPIQIKQFKLFPVHDTFSDLRPEISAYNPGTTVASISGTLEFTGMRGEIKETKAIFPDLLLGKSTRTLRVSNREGAMNLPSEPVFRGPLFPGIYKIQILVSHPQLTGVGATTTKEVTILVFPIRISVGILVFSLLFAIARRIFRLIFRQKPKIPTE